MISLLFIMLIPAGLSLNDGSGHWQYVPCIHPAMRYKKPVPDNTKDYAMRIVIKPNTVTLFFKFDSEAEIDLRNYPNTTNFSVRKLARPKNSYFLTVSGTVDPFPLHVKVIGPGSRTPYIESAYRDYRDICEYSRENGYYYTDLMSDKTECGRSKAVHTELIVHGQSTKPGDWPWHVAILRIEKTSRKYICGGTLLSKTLVLTAAHCASIKGIAVVPGILAVLLGKHNLIGGDIETQERQVFQVILHPEFNGVTLDNDIALLKLKSEVVFTDYVQPACLWHEDCIHRVPDRESIFGTVVGWGFDHEDSLSSSLQKITIPIESECTCLKSNPTFFHNRLNYKKMCAGFANGSSVCNGDSGGGLMIFVPDSIYDDAPGAWYVRGIVSTSSSRTDTNICDPNEYTIFTDVEKYLNWLHKNGVKQYPPIQVFSDRR